MILAGQDADQGLPKLKETTRASARSPLKSPERHWYVAYLLCQARLPVAVVAPPKPGIHSALPQAIRRERYTKSRTPHPHTQTVGSIL